MRISLRLKLGLLTLLLFAIPLSGFRLSSLLQESLMETRRETLMFSARAVASALSGRSGLFDRELFHSLDRSRDLYLFQLSNPMRLNGKIDDWYPQINEAVIFSEDNILFSTTQYDKKSFHFQHLIGERGDFLYAIFLITDNTIVYRKPKSILLSRSDHLQIGIEDKKGNLRRYKVATSEPGWVNGYLLPENPQRSFPVTNEPRIQGVWRETQEGYNIELRIPLDLIGHKLAFAVADVDDPATGKIKTILGTANPREKEEIGWLLTSSTIIAEILKSLNRPHSRIQIVDINQHIRASYGTLETEKGKSIEAESNFFNTLLSSLHGFLTPLYRLFTEPFTTEFTNPETQPKTLDIQGLKEGLQGKSSVTSYRLAEGQVEVMAAITPLMEKEKIIGAVVVEQTTNEILAMKNRVIEESITLTVLVLTFGGMGLLFFAFRVSSRIRRLRNQATEAIGTDGQILEIGPPSSAKDEIGDLSRTLSSMLNQLKSQSEYREKMADNLEHEMRTPLASISASLKNIAKEMEEQPEHINNYVNWALRDIQRLEDLLSAIRDATSLKEALDGGFMEDFLLDEALSLWIEHGWQPAFPQATFHYTSTGDSFPLYGDPDRIRQMIDKLIENSVAFHREKTPIELHLIREKNETLLNVINQGPTIPEDMLGTIFNSMVSIRSQKNTKPHLGLGLYIVRTIAEYHNCRVSAANLEDGRTGVVFSLVFPPHGQENPKSLIFSS